MHKRFSIAVYLVALVALVDQMSKWWIVHEVMQPPRTIPVSSFFNLVLVKNAGVTFGFLNHFDARWVFWFLLTVAGAILFLLGRWLWRTHSTPVAIGLSLIMGGAIGNVIDRLCYGVVIDFLDFHLGNYHWYSFNLADSAIVTGVGLLLLDGLIKGR